MIMAVKEDCGKIGGPQECAGCGKKIHDKFILKVTQEKGAFWKIPCQITNSEKRNYLRGNHLNKKYFTFKGNCFMIFLIS